MDYCHVCNHASVAKCSWCETNTVCADHKRWLNDRVACSDCDTNTGWLIFLADRYRWNTIKIVAHVGAFVPLEEWEAYSFVLRWGYGYRLGFLDEGHRSSVSCFQREHTDIAVDLHHVMRELDGRGLTPFETLATPATKAGWTFPDCGWFHRWGLTNWSADTTTYFGLFVDSDYTVSSSGRLDTPGRDGASGIDLGHLARLLAPAMQEHGLIWP